MEHFYPLHLNLKNKKTLVVGGGKVAERKVKSLLDCGAKVCIASPEVTSYIEELVFTHQVLYIQRGYAPIDLEDAFLVICATDNEEVNQKVAKDCFERNLLVNVVDDPSNCNFFVPSVVRRGSLSISISTEGKSPLLARRMREKLENEYGNEYEIFLEIMGELREKIIAKYPPNVRYKIFSYLVDSDILNLLKEGKYEEVKERIDCVFSGSWS